MVWKYLLIITVFAIVYMPSAFADEFQTVSAESNDSLDPSIAEDGNSEEKIVSNIADKNVPIIDGKFTSETEWSDATETKFYSNGYASYLLTKHDENYLYLMFDGVDFTINPNDESSSSSFQAIICFDRENDESSIRQNEDVCIVTTQLNEFGKNVRGEFRIFEYNSNGDAIAKNSNYDAGWNFGQSNDPYQDSIDHSTFEAGIPKEYLGSSEIVGFSFSAFQGSAEDDDLVQLVDGVIWPPYTSRENPSTWGKLVAFDVSNNLSPLKQWKQGYSPVEISCSKGMFLMINPDTEKPACLFVSSSMIRFAENGWVPVRNLVLDSPTVNTISGDGGEFTKRYFSYFEIKNDDSIIVHDINDKSLVSIIHSGDKIISNCVDAEGSSEITVSTLVQVNVKNNNISMTHEKQTWPEGFCENHESILEQYYSKFFTSRINAIKSQYSDSSNQYSQTFRFGGDELGNYEQWCYETNGIFSKDDDGISCRYSDPQTYQQARDALHELQETTITGKLAQNLCAAYGKECISDVRITMEYDPRTGHMFKEKKIDGKMMEFKIIGNTIEYRPMTFHPSEWITFTGN